ncbi:MAG: DUF2062 domain-containing protein [Candidatus Omnitrophota bacterium]
MDIENTNKPKERITFKGLIRKLWRMNNSPEDIALGVGIGAFISILPVYGLHTILAIGAALAIKRVNKIAVLLGTNVSTVVTVPFITWIAYNIGRFLLRNGGYTPLTWQVFRTFSYKTIMALYYPLFLGSVILGLFTGSVLYFLTFWFVTWRRKAHARAARIVHGVVIAGLITVFAGGNACAKDYTGEKIAYSISTGGTAEYTDLGIVDMEGRKVRSVKFKTHIGGLLDDVEVMYAEPDTLLPLKIERDVRYLLRKERIVEEYSPQTASAVFRKYVRNKFIKEYRFKEDSPIQNAILLPFYLRNVPDLHIGWSFDVQITRAYKVTLVAVDDVEVPAGRFMAYRFTSEPRKFDIWITDDADRIPVKIAGSGRYKYTLEMKSRSINP